MGIETGKIPCKKCRKGVRKDIQELRNHVLQVGTPLAIVKEGWLDRGEQHGDTLAGVFVFVTVTWAPLEENVWSIEWLHYCDGDTTGFEIEKKWRVNSPLLGGLHASAPVLNSYGYSSKVEV